MTPTEQDTPFSKDCGKLACYIGAIHKHEGNRAVFQDPKVQEEWDALDEPDNSSEQDKEPINASDELRVALVTAPEDMCEHGVNLRLCNCHRCDGTAIYTEADRKRVALEARIDELDKIPEYKWDNHKHCLDTDYVTERIAELKAQRGEE